MFDVQFYQLLTSPLERAMPRLLEKAVAGKFRVLLLAETPQRVEQLNDLLWTYDPGSFLPHGSVKDGHLEEQPVLLSTEESTENHPTIAFVTDGRSIPPDHEYARVLDMFDGQNEAATAAARDRWKRYKDAGCNVSYFKQTPNGSWEKAA